MSDPGPGPEQGVLCIIKPRLWQMKMVGLAPTPQRVRRSVSCPTVPHRGRLSPSQPDAGAAGTAGILIFEPQARDV